MRAITGPDLSAYRLMVSCATSRPCSADSSSTFRQFSVPP